MGYVLGEFVPCLLVAAFSPLLELIFFIFLITKAYAGLSSPLLDASLRSCSYHSSTSWEALDHLGDIVSLLIL